MARMKVPTVFSYLRDGYNRYRSHRTQAKALHIAHNRLSKISESGELLPKDLEQIMSTNKPGKPLRVKLRKLYDVVSRSLNMNNVYENTYDFDRIANIYEKEPYMFRAVSYYIESCLKQSQVINGNDPAFVDYIIRRFKEMELVTNQDMRQFDRQALLSLLLFGNIIISRRRNAKATSGKPYTRFDDKKFEPAAGYFVEDPRLFTIERDENRQVKYRRVNKQGTAALNYTYSFGGQTYSNPFGGSVNGKDKVFDKEDIIHIKFHPLPGNMWGTPPYLGVCDDLVTLRSIEECAELLVYQYGHPFLHAGIGTDMLPGTDDEIDAVRGEVESMEGNGMLVTSHRVKIENVTSKGAGVDLKPYLDYFKSRVFCGLNIDNNIAGEGETSNKESSNVIEKIHIGFVVESQTHLKMYKTQMMNDYKYEFPIKMAQFFMPRYEVSIEYPEVDINSKIVLENHYVNAFAQNAMTRTEARAEMGRKPMTSQQENDTFNTLITMANANEEGKMAMQQLEKSNQAQIQAAKIGAVARAKSASSTGSGTAAAKKKTAGATKKSQNKVTPSNQYGTKRTSTPKKG